MNKVFLGFAIITISMMVGSVLAHALDRPMVYKSWASDKHFIRKIEMSDEKGNIICLTNWRDPRFLKVLRDGDYDEVWVR